MKSRYTRKAFEGHLINNISQIDTLKYFIIQEEIMNELGVGPISPNSMVFPHNICVFVIRNPCWPKSESEVLYIFLFVNVLTARVGHVRCYWMAYALNKLLQNTNASSYLYMQVEIQIDYIMPHERAHCLLLQGRFVENGTFYELKLQYM